MSKAEADVTTIYLVRHVKSAPDKSLPESDWPLSDEGRRQAQSLTRIFDSLSVNTLWSSPFVRAVETLRPYATARQLRIKEHPNLRERKLCPPDRTDWSALLERAWKEFDFALSDCESSRMAQRRMLDSVTQIAESHPGKAVAIASHGNAIGLLLNHLDPTFGFSEWKAMRNPDVFRLKCDGVVLTWDKSFTFDLL
jgi:2,3-bisphosphoglycerate-dependent phosphoglycerate mutase